jgi:hypothetical protein
MLCLCPVSCVTLKSLGSPRCGGMFSVISGLRPVCLVTLASLSPCPVSTSGDTREQVCQVRSSGEGQEEC